MPSPFPGMAPYLERSVRWSDVHVSLLVCCRAQLNVQLPEGFQAKIETELRIEGAGPRIQFLSDAPPQRFIQIFLVSDPARIVTIIGVLSPANKSRNRGYEDYQAKQETLLNAPVNLLEIDLLREGEETVALPHRDDIPDTPYIVTLHRAGEGRNFDTWPISLRESLPRVAVPLTAEYPDLILDMQEALTQAYDLGGYGRGITYTNEPAPPLSPNDADWVDALLREKRLRPG